MERLLFVRGVRILSVLILSLGLFGLALSDGHSAWGQGLGPGPSAKYVPGSVLVKFKTSAAPAKVKELHESIGGVVKKNGLKKIGVEHINLPGHITVQEAIEFYRRNPDVEYAQPNYIYSFHSTFPNDPSFAQLWGLDNVGQTGGTPNAHISAAQAWDITTGSSDVVIAVIDTGVDLVHPDLVANLWVNEAELNGLPDVDDDGNGYVDDIYGWDFVEGDSDPTDLNSHGTHVSGTIAGSGNDGIGVSGVMWSARIMAVRFLDAQGFGETDDAVEAILFAADNGARIINASWGGYGFDQALYDAIAYAASRNVLFMAAAGNDTVDTEIFPFYPSGFDLPNIISVAATNHNDQIASISNYGSTTVDLGAPGVSIYSTVPGGFYDTFSGTSMATPHVAGAAGLVLSANPELSYQQIKNTILNNVDWKPSLAGKTVRGGRLNAFRALTSVITVNPNAGPVGAQFTISGVPFGGKKGSVLIGGKSVKVLEWTNDLIRCWINKTLPPGTYHVEIKRKEPKKVPPIVLEYEFIVEE